MEVDDSARMKSVIVIGPTDGKAAGASTVGAIIDVAQNERFESLTYVIQSGTITTGSFSLVLEESDEITFGGEETVVPTDDIVGTSPTWAVTDDDVIVRLGIVSKKRFQRLTLVGASTPVADFSAIAILGSAHVGAVAEQTV